MSAAPIADRTDLPMDVLDGIDRACDRFEAAWAAGERPRIEEHLGAVGAPYGPALLRELLAAELNARRRRGERPEPREYHDRFPTEVAAIESAFSPPDEAGQPSTRRSIAPSGTAGSDPTIEYTRAGTGVGDTPIREFGDYELIHELARGGMGVVYRARQASLNRTVAVKMIRAGQLATAEDVRRFQIEAEAAAHLDHPGIVPVYESGEYRGQHFYSMGFVEGQSLAQRLVDGPLSSRDAAHLVKQVAEAVAYAHDRGVIHRDLKPANILVDAHGHPRVTDFGLAKKVQADSGLTATGQILGTPSYMPPEQAAGGAEISAPGDIYSMGATLYCLVTGRPPFQAAGAVETLIQVRTQEPVSPRALNPTVARDLETIILKCLEKAPARRYPTARALVEDLGRFLAGEPITARPSSYSERLFKWARRRPAIAGLLSLVVAVTAAGFAGVMAMWREASKQGDLANHRANDLSRALGDRSQALKDLVLERGRVELSLRDARTALYTAQLTQARRTLELLDFTEADRLLDLCRTEDRGWDHRYLTALRDRCGLPIPGRAMVAFHPDGTRLAVGDLDEAVQLRDVASGASWRPSDPAGPRVLIHRGSPGTSLGPIPGARG